MFTVNLEKERVQLKSNSEMWHGKQSEVLTEKMRKSILDKGRKIGVDTKALSEEVLMTETLPWEKAWQSFQEQVIDSQTGALKWLSAAALGHKLKVTATSQGKDMVTWQGF